MDVHKILGELQQEREQIEQAILSLERLARGHGKRRGRPPKWLKEAETKKPSRLSRRQAASSSAAKE